MESSINATPVVCDSKQVVEYGVSDSNSTYCGKIPTYHVTGIFLVSLVVIRCAFGK